MILAVRSTPPSDRSRRPEPAARFPRPARPDAVRLSSAAPQEVRAQAPPAPPVRDEEDAERWDGMS